MSKAILISIKPQHLVNILNGKKTIEIRKNKALANAIENLIQEESYATIYVYCCYGFTLSKGTRENELTKDGHLIINKPIVLNGKVVCSFKCYKVEEIFGVPYEPYYCDSDLYFETNSLRNNKLLEKSCLNHEELENYLNDVSPYGYAIHISDLIIFDTPKELSEFIKCDNSHIRIGNCFIGFGGIPRLTKAPQNFAYVEIPNDN